MSTEPEVTWADKREILIAKRARAARLRLRKKISEYDAQIKEITHKILEG